mmetsp:Transcript_2795/g.4180  ORF Transcript_2795/g.4180 Transcript_2795/m.4180 type:complete len:85 (-) Transcript_2795:35-289(-)
MALPLNFVKESAVLMVLMVLMVFVLAIVRSVLVNCGYFRIQVLKLQLEVTLCSRQWSYLSTRNETINETIVHTTEKQNFWEIEQ